MKKLFAPCLFIFAVLGVSIALADPPSINGAPTAAASGDIATTQQQIAGDSSCSLTNTGGSGNTVAIETSNNPAQGWTVLGSVTTGNTGTFNVGSTNTGILWFKLTVTVYGSGTLTAGYACNGAVQGSSGSSGAVVAISPLPLPVTTAPPPVFPSPYATASPGGVLAAAPVGANGSPYPVDASGIPYVHPTAIPTTNVACVSGGCPTPQPLQTAASGAQTHANCDPTTSLLCAPVTAAGLQVDPAPTQAVYGVSGTTTAGTTVQLIAPVAGKQIRIYFLAFQFTTGGTAPTLNFEWGTGTTCGTNTVTYLPVAVIPTGIALNEVVPLWSNASNDSGALSFPASSAVPLVLPSGYALCGIPAGTTTTGKFFWYASQY